MFGTTNYELSLVKDYVAHWGLAEAARELVQNALDGESPFKYSFEPTDEGGWAFRLNSEFAKLDPKTLLLGQTTKADNADAIGSFGEGYKIALLVLTRLGHPVTILNGHLIWRPIFRFSKKYDAELLNIEETRADDRSNQGLTYIVEGLDDQDRAAIESCCLKMQAEIGQTIPTQNGDILIDRPGELYVGSLFVCRTEMHFGYDVKPGLMALERDRKTVDSWDIGTMTRDMWYETKQFDRIAQMIADSVPDLRYAKYSSPEIVKEACYALFMERNPGGLIASSPTELKKMIEEGLTETVYVGEDMHAQVANSNSYRAHNKTVRIIHTPPHEVLREWLAANRSEMRGKAIEAFKKDLLTKATTWSIK